MGASLEFGNVNINSYHPEHLNDPGFCYGTLSPEIAGAYLINLVFAPYDLELPQDTTTERQRKITKLIHYGADITLDDANGTTALDWAISNELEIATLSLISALVKRDDEQSFNTLIVARDTANAMVEIKDSSFARDISENLEKTINEIEKNSAKQQKQREAESASRLKEMQEKIINIVFEDFHPYDLDSEDFSYKDLSPEQAGRYLITLLANPTSARNPEAKNHGIGNSDDRFKKISSLIECGANLQIKNKLGFSALDYAVQNEFEVAVHLISNALSSADEDLPVSAYRTILHAQNLAKDLKTPFGKAATRTLAGKKRTALAHAKKWHKERYTP